MQNESVRIETRIEMWPIGRLKPRDTNSRTHSEQQIDQIVASMREFGWTNPVLVGADDDVIAGHARLKAAVRLGLAEVPVIPLGYLTPDQRRALVIADNQLALNAGWDMELLTAELELLKAADYDLELLGFSDAELADLLNGGGDGLTDEDAIPDVPDAALSKPGDLWVLGNHRLLCGNSTLATDVERLLADVKPHLMVTDPPYGVKYDPAWRKRAGINKSKRMGEVANDDRSDWTEAWQLFPGSVAYVWHGALHAATVAESLETAGFSLHAQIIWAKSSLVMGRGHYHWQHEPCWYVWRDRGGWPGDRKQSTLWQIDSRAQDAETVHSTQKPVECMRRPMLNNSNGGQSVYEPFSGSGTTIIAAETADRQCYAMELEPRYVDVAVDRWQKFTGKAAALEDGTTFDSLRESRCGK